ncbi:MULTISPECIES: DUF1127 domain-containing protein [Hoeflea]|uniref:DUF1127 domain-containing protein n=1 Tax=Hoeflea alexandrii TaxID=288436 RepID=A0ABT1CWF3_9HYPH|nr:MULTISPECIES: DUF1127 domain-containing protein [Hoeflea]MBV6648823.1 DUF1127 domain-containing protein [Hoeflea sp.]MCO6410517.1 DUF1127 domain-containing protein [Hoeflea alexandrii]MCY0152334.1 DUF1127 domain-containing protein [Hoeflea alexandrii]VVT23523.1 conserved hypothetical protein [Hoeflea sp. EC-HK425]
MNARSFTAALSAVRTPGFGSVVLGFAHALVRNVRQVSNARLNRRKACKIAELSDRELSDIGLTRDDVRYGFSVPFNADPTVELARRARLNSYY